MFKKQLAVFAIMMAMISICALSATQENYGVIKGSKPSTIGRNDRIEAAATTFDYLWYWPAEAGSFNAEEWQFAPQLQPGTDGNYTAHFRDVALGAAITVNCSGLESGETWSATWTSPTGAVKGTSTLTYQNGCFYGGLWYTCECGWPPYISTNIFTFYTTIQCSDTGVWTVDLAHNGVIYATKQINILPQVDESRFPQKYSQLNYYDNYDHICHNPADYNKVVYCAADDTSMFHFSIADQGCALTAACTILGYHGVIVDPPTLNQWLISNNGYTKYDGLDNGGSILPYKIADYAFSKGVNVQFRGRLLRAPTSDELVDDLCKYGPQMAEIRDNPRHWVTAVGKTEDLYLWKTIDPSGGVNGYAYRLYDEIAFSGPQEDFTDRLNGIHFDFYCPIEAFVTDPIGRKLGYDPVNNKTYDEIPWSGYGGPLRDLSQAELLDPPKEIEIVAAINGDYLLKITGTAIGKYGIGVSTHSASRQSHSSTLANNVLTSPNEVHSYSVHYDSSNLSATYVSGGFDGGGQRPKDVNKFLSYANPSDSQTDLPAGTTTFPLMVFYGNNAITSTFKASLNGVDITNLFSPTAGNHETVNLPLGPGRNVLSLSADGNLPSRVATDTDRLVFIVK
ncbi:MAG TPA: hypothetical protein PKJ37_03600 [Acidobacteriota bacterium]|nr:hypothetical protein [Acidobacteriota bacterium]HNT16968.1 hypothetical protein [Acidobacteriota bacterium]